MLRSEQGMYRANGASHSKADDARVVQMASSGVEDWRNDRSAGGRSGDRSTLAKRLDHSQANNPPKFQSREHKLAAMGGDSWEKELVKHIEPPRRGGNGSHRDADRREHHRERGEHRRDQGEYRRDQGEHRRDQGEHRRDQGEHRRDQGEHRDDRRGGDRDRDRGELRERQADNSSWPGGERGKRVKDTGDPHLCNLVGKGAERLKTVLSREFLMCPRQDANRKSLLPNLSVTAAYLISYVVENLLEEGLDMEGNNIAECRIYGGEARAIVAAEYNVEDTRSRPTGLNLRFKIGLKSFESCRDVVERFLVGRLREVIPDADPQLIRQCYFQRQVVIGTDFSLLSIGDPVTGRNLDLEFTASTCSARCFFDDANAFVIPLPDPAHCGWVRAMTPNKSRGQQEGPQLMARSLSAPWQTAVDYIRNGQLNIEKPELVFNGLILYAHALSDKQLTPGSRALEHSYGAKFAEAFLKQAQDTCKTGSDPLRFIQSFLRSHYRSRPINALACLSLLLAVLRAHPVQDEITPECEKIAQKLAEALANLCRQALQSSGENGDSKDAAENVLKVVRFAAHPFTAVGSSLRDETVDFADRQSLRLRRQLSTDIINGSKLWEEVCRKAADFMAEKPTDESKRADVEAVCEALKSLGPSASGEKSGDDISDDNASDQEESSQCTDDEGTDRLSDKQSAVASSKSVGSVGDYMSSNSDTPSPYHEDDETSNVSNDEPNRDAASTLDKANREATSTPDILRQNQTEVPRSPRQVQGSAKTSKKATKVSAETTNFARYCRLLMDVGRDVLMILFETSYQKEGNAPWTESSGRAFLSTHFPDDPSQRRLGKHLIDNICKGHCKTWDITLLSALLTTTPGYIKKNQSAVKAVEYLRGERNNLAHSAELLAKQSLTEEDFAGKWEPIMKSLAVLLDDLLPGHKAELLAKIDKISTETLPESDLTSLFEQVNEDINCIRDMAEDAREKAHEALEKAGNAASLSKVNELIAKSLKSVLNRDGRVDQKSLPCEVILSNQHRYRVYKLVGKGGMGAVYEAKLIAPDADGIKVAVKICDPNASSERAEREADILQKLTKLNHENVVRFIDSALDGSLLVIIMELIKGKPLEVWLDEKYADVGNRVTLDQTKSIVQQLVAGMAFVHSHNIAHRDLKPGNLMFDEVTGKLVIVDFGLSKQHNTNSTMTKADAQLGTLLYMSPEQLESDIQAISFPSDVWAIGVIWHELLTSRTPFQPLMQSDPGSSSNARSKARTISLMDQNTVMNMVSKKGLRQLPMLEQLGDVPQAITVIIARCLNADRYSRHRDATELSCHIEDAFCSLASGGSEASAKKSFKDWDAQSVCKLVRSISSRLAASADAMEKAGCINGECFMDMLGENDELLTTNVEGGGLGFSRLELRSVKSKIANLK